MNAANIAKAARDALNEIAYHDDSQVVECVIRKRYCFMQKECNYAGFGIQKRQ